MQSRQVPATLFRVPVERFIVYLEPLLIRGLLRITTLPYSLLFGERLRGRTGRANGRERLYFHRHDQQFPGWFKPQRCRKSPRGSEVPMRPQASIGTTGEGLGDEGGAVAEPSISRMNRNLRGPVRGEPG